MTKALLDFWNVIPAKAEIQRPEGLNAMSLDSRLRGNDGMAQLLAHERRRDDYVTHTLYGETMGTRWRVQLCAPQRAPLQTLHAGVQAQLDTVVAQMSTWKPESDISRYNRAPAGSWHALPNAFSTVLRCALEVAAASDGAYDPTVAPLVALWGFGADGGEDRRVPDDAAIANALARSGWRRIVFDVETGLVQQPGDAALDLSAIAKGFGVDAVADWLRGQGIAAALVDVGGELSGYGRKPDGECWRVLVEAAPDDDENEDAPCVIALDGCAAATSGDHWHRFEADGRHYSHTLDPRNGRPVAQAPAAVTVIAADAMHADAWATALTVLGADAGHALAEAHGLAARFVVRTDGSIVTRSTLAFDAHLA
jgi:thiamine biosynthesis lipoprotein